MSNCLGVTYFTNLYLKRLIITSNIVTY